MASAVIRGLSEETHAVLEARACQHKRSTEAEIRQICADAVVPMLERGQAPCCRRLRPAPCARECRRRHDAGGSEAGNGVNQPAQRRCGLYPGEEDGPFGPPVCDCGLLESLDGRGVLRVWSRSVQPAVRGR